MFEWFFAPYARLLQGVESLLVIPGTCGAPVDVLRALTLLLCAAAGARIGAHWVADRRLRRQSPVYGPHEFSGCTPLPRGRRGSGLGASRAAPAADECTRLHPGAWPPSSCTRVIRRSERTSFRACGARARPRAAARNLRALLAASCPSARWWWCFRRRALPGSSRWTALRFEHAACSRGGDRHARTSGTRWRGVFGRELSATTVVRRANRWWSTLAGEVWSIQRALPRRRGRAGSCHP